MQKKSLNIKNKKIIIEIYNPEKSNKNTIIFLPGYNMKPKDYKPFLKKLSKRTYAINYLNLKPKIKSLNEYKEIVKKTIKELGLKDYYIIGHSLGGGVTFLLAKELEPKKAIAINPLSEVDYHLKEYKKRFLEVAKDKFFKRLSFYIIFIIRYLSNIFSLKKIYKSIEGFKVPSKIQTPFLILIAEKDEFFKKDYIPQGKFNNIKFIETKGRHFNLVHFSDEISKKVNEFLKEGSKQ